MQTIAQGRRKALSLENDSDGWLSPPDWVEDWFHDLGKNIIKMLNHDFGVNENTNSLFIKVIEMASAPEELKGIWKGMQMRKNKNKKVYICLRHLKLIGIRIKRR